MNHRDDDLDADFEAGFAELRRATTPPDDLLEERVVRALKARGFLSRPPLRRLATLAAALAATLLLFFSGLMVGRSMARQPRPTATVRKEAPVQTAEPAPAAPPRQVYWF
jgi:hypothetical protein